MRAKELVQKVESYHCPNSTDAGMLASNHRIDGDGYCGICDRHILALARMHGIY